VLPCPFPCTSYAYLLFGSKREAQNTSPLGNTSQRFRLSVAHRRCATQRGSTSSMCNRFAETHLRCATTLWFPKGVAHFQCATTLWKGTSSVCKSLSGKRNRCDVQFLKKELSFPNSKMSHSLQVTGNRPYSYIFDMHKMCRRCDVQPKGVTFCVRHIKDVQSPLGCTSLMCLTQNVTPLGCTWSKHLRCVPFHKVVAHRRCATPLVAHRRCATPLVAHL
jgi:hypothetical protein